MSRHRNTHLYTAPLAALVALSLSAAPIFAQDTTPSASPTISTQSPTLPGPADTGSPQGIILPADQAGGTAPAPQATTSQPAGTPAVAPQAAGTPVVTPVEAAAPEPAPASLTEHFNTSVERAREFLQNGGPAIWAIAALSVVTLAVILWKVWRLVLAGAWSRRNSAKAVALWEAGDKQAALARVKNRRGLRSRFCAATMQAAITRPASAAREEATRVARELLARTSGGLRALELIATIAPLLGLLGTVLGMIAAFQALQEAGNRADPALLAGGIWEALLTTAAGMAVAIPASVALTWFEAVIDRVRQDMESLAARLFVHDAGLLEDPAKATPPISEVTHEQQLAAQ
ncbi:MotA/TolQ/ExbB proton channel family protein [Rhodobacteraceae bacterium D3-12]|nr:MotA/TolQ/ExbB proton channel family protein [Rhodobacteraceae bacterium D3-12]